jgi:hypothetical protein
MITVFILQGLSEQLFIYCYYLQVMQCNARFKQIENKKIKIHIQLKIKDL